jgi:hypothetical protein
MFSQQRHRISAAEIRSRRVHPPALGSSDAGAVLKPEGSLEAKTSLAFESSHLVHLAFHIQKLEITFDHPLSLAAFQLNSEVLKNRVLAPRNRALVREINFRCSLGRAQPDSQVEGCQLFLRNH